jgi:hypothetical protein
MNPGESQTPTSTNLNGGLNQSQTSPSKYDEAERVRQRMEELRRHHAETVEIHHRTQPMIDDQIHEDTLKYLKTGPVNGTKAKSQKPRAPKRQRSTASNNTSANSNNIITNVSNSSSNNSNSNGSNNHNHNQFHVQTSNRTIGPNNSLQHHSIGPPLLHQQQQQHQPQHPQQQHSMNGVSLHSQPRHIMQQSSSQTQMSMPMSMQPVQHMQAYSSSAQQPIHIQPQQTNQMLQPQSYDNYQNGYQTQPIYQQRPQQQIQPVSHGNSHTQSNEQGHHHYMNSHSNTFAQQNHQSFYPSHQMINSNVDHHYTTLPNDLDLNIQAGLECDIESLIKHEMSVEGQLDFNPDLLVKLDNYYQPNYQ